jgi:hypothetical protein
MGSSDQYAPMSNEMRERVNEAIRFNLAKGIDITEEYIDQAQSYSLRDMPIVHRYFFSSYTPWGVACIEAAFLDRIACPAIWDSKDRIRMDILSNPHLHLNIKDRLLRAFESGNWERWYDSFYILGIKGLKDKDPPEKLREEIIHSPYLSNHSRENLLYNLSNLTEA